MSDSRPVRGLAAAAGLVLSLAGLAPAEAASTGNQTANAVVSAGAWTNFTVASLSLSDDNWATNAANNDYGVLSNFDFTMVPLYATIAGIRVRVEGSDDTAGQTVNYAVQLSWDAGASWTTAKTDSFTDTIDANHTLGSTTDTWGRSWSAAEPTKQLQQTLQKK